MRTARTQRRSHGFVLLFLVVFISGMALSGPSAPRRSRVRRQNMKVRINATGDTIVMKFVLPNADTKLEGYILGYGSSMFSKQFIQLPEDGKPYETEFDAEPKYLIAVQPVPNNEVKKKCTGKVDLEKPLHLVIGSVSPTSVVLSWGALLKTSYQGNIMNDCLEDGHYTVRYREKNRKWNYQTCPTKDTVIDNLKPNTVYEFGVQPSSKDGTGAWSKPVIHNVSTTAIDEKTLKKIFTRPVKPLKPQTPGPNTIAFSPRHVHLNRTQGRQVPVRNTSPKTTLAPSYTVRQKSLLTPGPRLPVVAKQPIGREDFSTSVLPPIMKVPLAPKSQPSLHITTTTVSLPVLKTDVETRGWPALFHTQQMPHSHPHIQTTSHPHPKFLIQKHVEPIVKQDSQSSQTEKIVFQSHPQSQTTINPYPVNQHHQQLQPTFQSQAKTPKQLQPKPEVESVSLTSQSQPKIKQKPKSESIFHLPPENEPEQQTKQASWDIDHMHSHTSTHPQFKTQPQQPQVMLLPKHRGENQQQPKPKMQLTSTPKLNIQPLDKPQVLPKPTSQPTHWTEPQSGTKFATKRPHFLQTQSPPTSQPIHWTEPQSGTKFATKRPHFSQTQSPPTSQPIHWTEPQSGTKFATKRPHFLQTQSPPTSQPIHWTEPQSGTKFATKRPHFLQTQSPPTSEPIHWTEPQSGTKFATKRPHFLQTSSPPLYTKQLNEYQPQTEKHSGPVFESRPLDKSESQTVSQPQTINKLLPSDIPRFSAKPQTNHHSRLTSTFKPETETRKQLKLEITFPPKHQHDPQSQPTLQPSPKSTSERHAKPTKHSQTRQLPKPGSKPKHSKKPKSQSTSRPKTLTRSQLQPKPTFKSKLHTQPKTTPKSFPQDMPTKKFKPKTNPQTISPTKMILTNPQSSFQPKNNNEYRTHYKTTFPPVLKRPNEPLPKETLQYHPLNDSKSENQPMFIPKGQPEQQKPELQPRPPNKHQLQPQPTIKSESDIKKYPQLISQPTLQNKQIPQHPEKFQPKYHEELPQTLQPEQMQTTIPTILRIQSQPKPKFHQTPQGEPRPLPQPQPELHPHSLPERPQSKPLLQSESRNEPLPLSQITPVSLDEPHLHTVLTTARLKTQTKPQLRTTSQPKPLNKPPPRIQSAVPSPSQSMTTPEPIFQTKSEPKYRPIIYSEPRAQPKTTISDPKPSNKPPSKPDTKLPLQLQTEDQSQTVFQSKDHQEPYAQPQPTLQAQPEPLNEPQLQTTLSSILKQFSPNQQFSKAIIHEPPQPKPILEPRPLNKSEFHPTMQSKPQIQQQPQPISQPILQPNSQNEAQSEPTLPAYHHTDKQPLHTTKLQRKHTQMAHHQATTLPMFQTKSQTQPNKHLQFSHSTPELQHKTETKQSLVHILPKNPKYQHLPHPTSQPIPPTHFQSRNNPKTHHKLESQTAFTTVSSFVQQQKQYIKHHVHPQTQQPPSKSQPEHQIPDSQAPHTTFKYIPQTQPTLLKTLAKSQQNDTAQIKPEQKNNPKPQKTPKKEPKTQSTVTPKKHTSPTKTKGEQKTKSQSKEKTQHEPKLGKEPKLNEKPKHPPKKQQKLKPNGKKQKPNSELWPKQQSATERYIKPIATAKPIYQLQPSPSTHSPLESLSNSYPGSRLKQQPHPWVPIQPLNWTLSEPTKLTPLQSVPTAPSPPEGGKPLPRPALAAENAGSYNQGSGIVSSSIAEVPQSTVNSSSSPAERRPAKSRPKIQTDSGHNNVQPFYPSKTLGTSLGSSTPRADGEHHKANTLPKAWPKEKPVQHLAVPVNKKPNLVGKPSYHEKPLDPTQGQKESILKPFSPVTSKPPQERRQETTTYPPIITSTRFDNIENSSVFRPLPTSAEDSQGKKRYTAPHVVYKTDKKPDEPCSITSSLAYFPDEDPNDLNVTSPPRVPPSNLTVVTVEGCPSFVILDWEKSDNETREYEVVSTSKGPNGDEVSVLTTNQTHTAVENLKPENSYEFKVTPKNELGPGPSSDPVSFQTESADPRVSEHVSGKDAIWTQFPFESDAYSECNGRMFVKRTWYRKFVGIQLCNSLRYQIYLSDSLGGKFYNIGDQSGHGEDHCQFVDSFLDGRTGNNIPGNQLPRRLGFYRSLRQEPVSFGEIGGRSHATYVGWYECGTPIPGKW